MEGYKIDAIISDLKEQTKKEFESLKIASPIKLIYVWHEEQSYLPSAYLIFYDNSDYLDKSASSADLKIEINFQELNIPFSLFEVEAKGDKIMESFYKKFNMPAEKEEGALRWYGWWSSSSKIPKAIISYELAVFYKNLKSLIEKNKISKDLKVCMANPDETVDDFEESSHLKKIKAELKKYKDKKVLEEFARICYSSKEKQNWLISLSK